MVKFTLTGGIMTLQTQGLASTSDIDIGRVVRGTFDVVRARLPDLAWLAVAFVFVPTLLTGFLPPKTPYSVSALANLPGLIFDGAAALLAYNHLTSGPALTGSVAMSQAMRKFGALWGLGIISGLATILGLVLLVVPGVILMVGWMASTSVLMIENLKVTESLDRAWKLSAGQRWRLAGLLGITVAGGAGGFLVLIVIMMVVQLAASEALANQALDFVLTPLFVSVLSVFTAVGASAAYVELRTAKEGVVGGAVAEIFA